MTDPVRLDMAKLSLKLAKIRALVEKQAADEGLWFFAETAPEAYVQRALRKLYELIEK